MTFFEPSVQQPSPRGAQSGWMSVPTAATDCPPGLEYLSTINHLLVHQQIEMLEIITGYETNNKYTIKNINGQNVYYAVEVTHWCARLCCAEMRPFDIKILDSAHNEVIHLHCPLTCWQQSMEVSSPPGTVIGFVAQECTFCRRSLSVKNAAGRTILKIKGPTCTISRNIDYELYRNGVVVGKITKEWAGLARELFTDSDYFGITFPMHVDIRTKAVLLGACFLIDFMFYDH